MVPAGRKPIALVMLSGGGFAFETRRLLAGIADDADWVYLKTDFGGEPGEGGLPRGNWNLVPSFATKTRGSIRTSIYAFLKTVATTVNVIRRQHIDAVIVVGCSHAVPMFVGARLFGCKTIYVESVTRVDRLSTTGKIVYYLRLSKTFIVQWPELQKSHPASRFGTIL